MRKSGVKISDKIWPVDHEHDGGRAHEDDLKTPEANVRNGREHVEADIRTSDLNAKCS